MLLWAAFRTGAVKMSLSGTLDAVSTTGTVTSTTRTVSVPGGNSGVFTFSGYVDTGVILSTQYSRNGGALTTVADGADTEAFADGDTIAVVTNSVGVGEGRTFTVTDKTTGQTVETVDHTYG